MNNGQYAALVGIDWAHQKHDICLQEAGSDKLEYSVLEHSPEAIDAWARGLRERFGGRPVAMGLELTRGPLVSALQKYDFIALYPINPTSLARYRNTWFVSGAKDDPSDAALALDMMKTHPERFTVLKPQSAEMRALQQLVEARRCLVDDRTRITNRIIDALKGYHPHVLKWFDDRSTALFGDFLERWPTLEAVQKVRRDVLERFFRQHNVRGQTRIDGRIDAIKSAMTLTDDPGVVIPNQLLVRSLVAQLHPLRQSIAEYDVEIKRLCESHRDFAIFDSFPGAADVFAPRLLAAWGEDRSRFGSASEMQRYSGTAPVIRKSGQSKVVRWRFACPTFMRQSFVEWAGQTIPTSYWAGAYYRQQMARGKSRQTALRALAFKWQRIMYQCWQQRKPYDEVHYLQALQKSGSPLLQNAITAP